LEIFGYLFFVDDVIIRVIFAVLMTLWSPGSRPNKPIACRKFLLGSRL